jgi:hypothetical protein
MKKLNSRNTRAPWRLCTVLFTSVLTSGRV